MSLDPSLKVGGKNGYYKSEPRDYWYSLVVMFWVVSWVYPLEQSMSWVLCVLLVVPGVHEEIMESAVLTTRVAFSSQP